MARLPGEHSSEGGYRDMFQAGEKQLPEQLNSAMPYGVLATLAEDDSSQSEEEGSRAPSSYSRETFESFTEEEKEKVVGEENQLTERKPSDALVSSEDCQTWSHASESLPVSKKLTPSLKDGDEPVNSLDSVAAEEKLNETWIQVLKAKDSPPGQHQEGSTSQAELFRDLSQHAAQSPYFEDEKTEVQRRPASPESESLPLNHSEVAMAWLPGEPSSEGGCRGTVQAGEEKHLEQLNSAMHYGVLATLAEDDSGQSEEETISAPSIYSRETFESFTEEEKEKVVGEENRLNEGKPSDSLVSSEECQTWSHVSESLPVSKKLTASLKDGDEPVNPLDSVAAEEKLNEMWIQILKAKESPTGQHQAGSTSQAELFRDFSHHAAQSPYFEDGKTEVQRRPARPESESLPLNHPKAAKDSKEAQDALGSFCATKINLIHQQMNPRETKKIRHQKLHQRPNTEKPGTHEINNSVVPLHLMNRIYQQNLRVMLSKASTIREHEISKCPECTKKRGELAQKAFLRQKKTFLDSGLLKEKIEKCFYTKDFLSLIGEVHQSLPRLSDDPKTIWKRLTTQGQTG